MALYGTPDNFERYYLNQNPDAAFWHYLNMRGWGGNTSQNLYSQRQQNPTYNRYQAVAGQNPDMGFFDYLEQNRPDFQDQFLSQSPNQRGDAGSFRYAPRARYTRLS